MREAASDDYDFLWEGESKYVCEILSMLMSSDLRFWREMAIVAP